MPQVDSQACLSILESLKNAMKHYKKQIKTPLFWHELECHFLSAHFLAELAVHKPSFTMNSFPISTVLNDQLRAIYEDYVQKMNDGPLESQVHVLLRLT